MSVCVLRGAVGMTIALSFAACGPCRAEISDHERVLLLEKKLAKLEALLKEMSATNHAGKGAARKTEAVEDAREPSKPAKESARRAASTTGNDSAAPAPPQTAQSDNAQSAATPIGVGKPGDAPQELFVLRENSVTLKPSAWEVYSRMSYASRIGFLQTDRAALGSTTIRYGVFDWLELGATLPYGYAARTSQTGPGQHSTYIVKGFGDALIQANVRLRQQSQDWPGVVVSVGAILPTGPHPYTFVNYTLNGNLVANPTDPLRDFFSLGTWGVHTNLQFFKTIDPVILFAGGGVDYLFGDTVENYYVRQGLRYSYNAGFSLALSERTTVGFSINGVYQGNMTVDGRVVEESGTEPILARLSVIQRLAKNVFVEPSVSFGLNVDSPDVQLEVGLRAQF